MLSGSTKTRVQFNDIGEDEGWGLMLKICSAICAALFFMSQSVAAQSVSDARLINDTFTEGYSETLNVSAGIILGVAMNAGNGIQSTKETFLNKGGTVNADSVCVRISSIDGLFWAENTFQTKGDNALWRIAPLSKKHNAQVRQYGSAGLIGLVKTTATEQTEGLENICDSRGQTVLIPLQPETDVTPKYLTLKVNSTNRFTQAVLKSKFNEQTAPQSSALTDCQSVDFDIAAMFDQECHIEIPETLFGQIVEVELLFESPPFDTEIWSENIAIPHYEVIADNPTP